MAFEPDSEARGNQMVNQRFARACGVFDLGALVQVPVREAGTEPERQHPRRPEAAVRPLPFRPCGEFPRPASWLLCPADRGAGAYPEWELGIQTFPDTSDQAFGGMLGGEVNTEAERQAAAEAGPPQAKASARRIRREPRDDQAA
jgi:hypothetical protein